LEAGAEIELFLLRPVEQRIERLPVRVQLRVKDLEAGGVLTPAGHQLAQLRERRRVRAPELFEPLAVFGRALARRVEQVVAHENPRQVHARAQAPQVGFNLVVLLVQLVELRVDLLRLLRRRQHGDHHQQQQSPDRDGRHRPRSEPHDSSIRS
jgi:hypothetical protein